MYGPIKFKPETVATVLTVYGIETQKKFDITLSITVATVLTVYGIETPNYRGILFK